MYKYVKRKRTRNFSYSSGLEHHSQIRRSFWFHIYVFWRIFYAKEIFKFSQKIWFVYKEFITIVLNLYCSGPFWKERVKEKNYGRDNKMYKSILFFFSA